MTAISISHKTEWMPFNFVKQRLPTLFGALSPSGLSLNSVVFTAPECSRERGKYESNTLSALNVDVLRVLGPVHDESETRGCVFAHQVTDDFVGFKLIVNFDF